MLKVKMNLENVREGEFIVLNEIQKNNGHIVFPFYDNNGVVQYAEFIKCGDYYNLLFKEGDNINEVIQNGKDLEERWLSEGYNAFFTFYGEEVQEYEDNSVLKLIKTMLNVNKHIFYNTKVVNDTVQLNVNILDSVSIAYTLIYTDYGTIEGEGYIINDNKQKICSSPVSFSIPQLYEFPDVSFIADLIDNMPEDNFRNLIASECLNIKQK